MFQFDVKPPNVNGEIKKFLQWTTKKSRFTFAVSYICAGLHGRQRAPLTHSRRCLENHTRNYPSMSEILDEEVDYGPYGVKAFSLTDSDHAWSTFYEK